MHCRIIDSSSRNSHASGKNSALSIEGEVLFAMNQRWMVVSLLFVGTSCSDSGSEIDPALGEELRFRIERIENLDASISELEPTNSALEKDLVRMEELLAGKEEEKRKRWKELLKQHEDLRGWISLKDDEFSTHELIEILIQLRQEIERLEVLLEEHGIEYGRER